MTLLFLYHKCNFRRGSNRHTNPLSRKGGRQATRTVHALTRAHAPNLTQNPIVMRIVRRSALNRLKRLSKESRSGKAFVKLESRLVANESSERGSSPEHSKKTNESLVSTESNSTVVRAWAKGKSHMVKGPSVKAAMKAKKQARMERMSALTTKRTATNKK